MSSVTYLRKVRQILMRSGAVGESSLDEALAASTESKTSLSEVLEKSGLVPQKSFLGIIASETNFIPVDLPRITVEGELLEQFPLELAEKYGVCPVSKIGTVVTVAMPDPFDIVKLDQLRLESHLEIRPVIALENVVKEHRSRLYSNDAAQMDELLDSVQEEDVEVKATDSDDGPVDLTENAGGPPVVRIINTIVAQAVKERASDIHIEPYEKLIKVRYRQDGLLRDVATPPKNIQAALVSRVKIMAGLDIAERRKPQDGKFQARIENRQIDFRVSVLPVVHGEKVVMRILDGSNLALNLDSLGFESKALIDYREAIQAPYGMILITGPTGSGKSTTLYSALKEIATPDQNVVTVEDPVEYQMEGINQVPVNNKRELTFAAALRSILRQDPDTILIGEIRDKETLEIAVKAALTGHLVLSTLHTNDAASTITRMVDMGLDPFMVGSSTILICAQRLARKLCENCRQPVSIPHERLHAMGFLESDLRDKLNLMGPGPGCTRCNQGYKGRFAILETMPFTEGLRRVIIDGGSSVDIKQKAIEEGMVSLRRAGLLNAARGKTSVEEVVRSTMAD